MPQSATLEIERLEDYLERYLSRVGLLDLIPERRRRVIFTIPTHLLWIGSIWILASAFVHDLEGTPHAVSLLQGLLLICAALVFVFVLSWFVSRLTPRTVELLWSQEAWDSGFPTAVLLPISTATLTALYLRSASTLSLLLFSYALLLVLVVVIHHQSARIWGTVGLLRSMLRLSPRSMSLLPILVPLLVALVLFPLFTAEIWEVLANVGKTQIPIVLGVIALPVVLLAVRSLRCLGASLVVFPDHGQIVREFDTVPAIAEHLAEGWISEDDISRAKREMEWRAYARIKDAVTPHITSRIVILLSSLLFITTLALTVIFSVYFAVLFRILIAPEVIASWAEGPGAVPTPVEHHFLIFGYPLHFTTLSTTVILVKVALLLAFIVAVLSNYYAVTEQEIKARYSAWLERELKNWIPICCAYTSLLSPRYQVWDYVARDRRKGVAELTILVPPDVGPDEIRDICLGVRGELGGFRRVIVSAFRHTDGVHHYGPGFGLEQWQLVHEEGMAESEFLHLPPEEAIPEVIHDHSLGRKALAAGAPIPDEWFGDTGEAREIGRLLWDHDREKLILHPSVSKTGSTLAVTVRMTKRLASRRQYRAYLNRAFTTILQRHSPEQRITLTLLLRDQPEWLATLAWTPALNLLAYRDEMSGFRLDFDPSPFQNAGAA